MQNNRGYIGHEMLDQLALVNMNGPVYDPLTARFLSAAPYFTKPLNGQNYNRYSYVLNNPTNLTDPTGFATITITGARPLEWYIDYQRGIEALRAMQAGAMTNNVTM